MTTPFTTVVVPTADRPQELARCLEALARMDYPPGRLEIVVVDDAGTADVGAVCRAPRGHLPLRLVRHAERRGPGAARNTGAQVARGDVLVFTDDDCLPDRDWLVALTNALADDTAVGGRTRNGLRHNPFADASQHIVDLVYAHYNRDPAAARFFASNNLAVRRADFLAVGGFDDAQFPFAAEDRDFCDRWRASGRSLRFAPDAVVRHAHDLSLRGFVRQHLAYGRGAARFHRARARRGTGRLRDEVPFHFNGALWAHTLRLRPARRGDGDGGAALALAGYERGGLRARARTMSSAPDNGALIEGFYDAFDKRDGDRMAACYAPDARFSDPVFPDLRGREPGAMWQMLTGQANDLRVELLEHDADGETRAPRAGGRTTRSRRPGDRSSTKSRRRSGSRTA